MARSPIGQNRPAEATPTANRCADLRIQGAMREALTKLPELRGAPKEAIPA